MKLNSILFFLGLVAIVLAEPLVAPNENDMLQVAERKRKCVKVTHVTNQMVQSCGKKKVITMITCTVTVPPVGPVALKITIDCRNKKDAKKLAKRIIKCKKLFLKRCRCLRDERKRFCIENQVRICAGRNAVKVL